jgi:hypothetical protein
MCGSRKNQEKRRVEEGKNKPFLVGPTYFDQERLIYLDTTKYRVKNLNVKNVCKKIMHGYDY